MFEYIEGKIDELNPAFAVIQTGGIGYFVNISINTYSLLENKKEVKLFIHQTIREDAHLLYGFKTKKEREIFRQLISVNGVGTNTARMMLSSLNPDELEKSILEGNLHALKSIKGIGVKTAQRIVLDLKDKLGKSSGIEQEILVSPNNTVKEESLSALVMLGFAKNTAEKTLNKILSKEMDISVEELIKRALKQL